MASVSRSGVHIACTGCILYIHACCVPAARTFSAAPALPARRPQAAAPVSRPRLAVGPPSRVTEGGREGVRE